MTGPTAHDKHQPTPSVLVALRVRFATSLRYSPGPGLRMHAHAQATASTAKLSVRMHARTGQACAFMGYERVSVS